jgi:hypothetical protein
VILGNYIKHIKGYHVMMIEDAFRVKWNLTYHQTGEERRKLSQNLKASESLSTDGVRVFANQTRVFTWYKLPSRVETVSRGSSVSIVFIYRLDDRAIEVQYPAEAKGFFL